SLAILLAALPGFNLGAAWHAAGVRSPVAALHYDEAPIATIDGGRVRGVAVPGGYVFRGLPYADPPTGRLRWRAPQPPAEWHGGRDATTFAPSCRRHRAASRLAHRTRTACTSTLSRPASMSVVTRRTCLCSYGSTAAASRAGLAGTTTP